MPIGRILEKSFLTPDELTAAGIVLSVVTGLVLANGWLFAGLLLLIFSALFDTLDGALAKASGRASMRGAYFDSVGDRVSDAVVLGGVAWYLTNTHSAKTALLPMAILAASSWISYQRAKAESLGLQAKGGIMERAERIIVLCIGVAFEPLLIPVLWVMLALILITAVQRFVKVWKQAEAPPPAAWVVKLQDHRRARAERLRERDGSETRRRLQRSSRSR